MPDEPTRKPSIPRGTDEHSGDVSPQPSKTDAAGRHVRPDDSPTPPTMREIRGERSEARPTAPTSTAPKAPLEDRVEGDETREREPEKR